MFGKLPICYQCKHLDRFHIAIGFRCKAYPEKIPKEIITGEIDHTKSYKRDNGIQFEKDEDIDF